MKPTINSAKHILQHPISTVAVGAIANLVEVEGTPIALIANQQDVREGATVKAVYVELWITSDDDTQSSAIVSFEKVPVNAPLMTTAQVNSLNGYANKKNILHIFEGLVGPISQVPMPAFKGWVKIPKSKQRFGLDDKFVINIYALSDGLKFCGFTIFKEYY